MPNKPTTLREEEVSSSFEPKNKKLFEILKSLASTGNGDKYDPISAYKEIDRMFSSHNTELLQKIEGIVREETPSHFTREYRDTDSMRDRICKRCRELLQSSLCLTKTKKTDENNGEGGLEITEKIE